MEDNKKTKVNDEHLHWKDGLMLLKGEKEQQWQWHGLLGAEVIQEALINYTPLGYFSKSSVLLWYQSGTCRNSAHERDSWDAAEF